jgi:hypothetical protein
MERLIYYFSRGVGWLVPLLYVISFMTMAGILQAIDPHWVKWDHLGWHNWIFAAALAIPGIIFIVCGMRTNHQAPVILMNEQTGLRCMRRIHHSFWLIPIEYWGAPGIAAAAAVLSMSSK